MTVALNFYPTTCFVPGPVAGIRSIGKRAKSYFAA